MNRAIRLSAVRARRADAAQFFHCGVHHRDTPEPKRGGRAAAFFDRDGTPNRYRGYVTTPEQIVLAGSAADAVRLLNERRVLAVLITNQSVIAHGLCSEEDVGRFHARLRNLFAQQRAHLDGIYYCPHHPFSTFPDRRRDLRIPCICRKPAAGLIQSAQSTNSKSSSSAQFFSVTATWTRKLPIRPEFPSSASGISELLSMLL